MPILPSLATLAGVAATLAVALSSPSPSGAGEPHRVASRTSSWSPDSVIVGPAWLAAQARNPRVVVVHVVMDGAEFQRGHILGARPLSYGQLVTRRATLSSELRDPAELRAAFEAIGVSDDSHVVVYAHEGPMAARAIFTLAYLGHERASLLDGGLPGWRTAGHPVATDAARPVTAGRLSARVNPGVVADAEFLSARLGTPGMSLVDTRTTGEFDGTGNRSGMPSEGHLRGARQLEWQWLFREDAPLTLKSRDELRKLYADRVQTGDTVVSYCWVGYRASMTWLAARALGYEARMYDGSYQDWQQRRLPTVKTGG